MQRQKNIVHPIENGLGKPYDTTVVTSLLKAESGRLGIIRTTIEDGPANMLELPDGLGGGSRANVNARHWVDLYGTEQCREEVLVTIGIQQW